MPFVACICTCVRKFPWVYVIILLDYDWTIGCSGCCFFKLTLFCLLWCVMFLFPQDLHLALICTIVYVISYLNFHYFS